MGDVAIDDDIEKVVVSMAWLNLPSLDVTNGSNDNFASNEIEFWSEKWFDSIAESIKVDFLLKNTDGNFSGLVNFRE